MRHQIATKKIGRNSPHRKATLRNMATALFEHERIETTHGKARALRPVAEKLITLAKRGDLHARRLVARDIQDREVVAKLFDDIAERCRTRPGGYTRILRTGVRRGDNAMCALIELVDRVAKSVVPDEAEAKPKKKPKAEKKAKAPKVEEKTDAEGSDEKQAAASKKTTKKSSKKKTSKKKTTKKKTTKKKAAGKKTSKKKTKK